MKSVSLPAELTAIPDVAWPTVALFCVSAAGYLACAYAGAVLGVSAWLVVPLQVVLTYALFTPMHDAAHGSISGKYPLVNEVVGRLCGLAFAGPFPAFRFVHLQHHKYTNNAQRDPDYWSEGGPAWSKPLRWATQELYYYWFYVVNSQRRPLAERLESYGVMAAVYVLAACAARQGYGAEVVLFYLLPVRGALPVLALLFDWLPHHRSPRLVTSQENRYKATHKLKALFGVELWLPTLAQSMHCVHHLWPMIPFYRYALAWNHAGDQLRRAGVETWGVCAEQARCW